MSERQKSEHRRIQDIELYLDEIKPLLSHIKDLRTAAPLPTSMFAPAPAGLPIIWNPPIWMVPAPEKFVRTINKKSENRGDFDLTGPHESQTTDNGTVFIESKAKKSTPTSITVKHPPPPGQKNQTHNLPKGSRVTVQPNGDILIQLTA